MNNRWRMITIVGFINLWSLFYQWANDKRGGGSSTRSKLGKGGRLAAVQSLILIQSPVTVQFLILHHLWAEQTDKDTETNLCRKSSVFKRTKSTHMFMLLFGRSESHEVGTEFTASCSHKAMGECIMLSFFPFNISLLGQERFIKYRRGTYFY